MRRALTPLVPLVSLLAAACGDNVDDPAVVTTTPIEATCADAELDALVAKLPNVVSATKTACGDYVEGEVRCYQVMLEQPIDHRKPDGASFDQQLFVMHRGCDRPTVIADWGYSNEYFFDEELATLFQANAIWVEHRFQGESIPVGADWDWTQLTIENGARDLHRVIESFKHLYGANWVSTGASKGGITATYHSYFFPDDLNGFVPYVAPASRSRMDQNYQIYLDSRLTSECAQRVRSVQIAALTTRRPVMLAKVGEAVGSMEIAPDYLDILDARFDWAFWQYYGEKYCPQVPNDAASDEAFWNFFAKMSGLFGPDPATAEEMSNGALSYEWLTEQGFAFQIGGHVLPLLQSEYATQTMEESFIEQFPDVPLPVYDGSVTRAARHWATHYAENMLLIYGQFDPWSGGALDEPERPTSARFFVPGATHGSAQIGALPVADRDAALAHAARMFGVQPVMPMMRQAVEAGQRRDAILARHEQRVMMRLP
jgi:hypothetical protein